MSLNVADMQDAIFSELLVKIPTINDAVRSNPTAGIRGHNVTRELVGGMAGGIVSAFTSLTHTSTHAPDPGDPPTTPPSPLTVGPGVLPSPAVINPLNPLEVLYPMDFPNLSTTLEVASTAMLATLGWGGVAAKNVIDGFVEGVGNYVAGNLQGVYPLALPLSGGFITTVVVAPTLSTVLSTATQANLLASGLFHYNDDPTLGLAPELIRLIDAWSAAVTVILTSTLTTISIPPVGILGGVLYVFPGALV